MLGRREDARLKKVQAGEGSVGGIAHASGVADSTTTITITTTTGRVLTLSEFISLSDEAAIRRLDKMNQKLRDLEMQMEALEAEIRKANDSSPWS